MFGDDLAFALQSTRIGVAAVLEAIRGAGWVVFFTILVPLFSGFAYLMYNLWQIISAINPVGFLSEFGDVTGSPWWQLVRYCANLRVLNSILTISYVVFSTVFVSLSSIWMTIELSHVVPAFIHKVYATLKRLTGV